MKLSGWQRAWVALTLLWVAYWAWITRGMSFDAGNMPFVLRAIVLPPIVLYIIGWLAARIVRLVRSRRDP